MKKNLFNLFFKKKSLPLKKPIDKLINKKIVDMKGAEANKNNDI